MKLPIPHFQQELPYTCLPACVRMVLAHHGEEYSEDELAQAFNPIPDFGTHPKNAVTGLEEMGYHALWFENASLERLIELLNNQWPIIVFVMAADLPHGHSGLHAVVVVGIEDKQIICLDPILMNESRFELSFFSYIWGKLDNQGLVIWP